MNKTTLATTQEQYNNIIRVLEHGFKSRIKDKDGNEYFIKHRPNHRVAFALKLERATGRRISDIVKLRMRDIVQVDGKYRVCITEKKKEKKTHFRLASSVYDCIDQYCADHNIPSDRAIIGGSVYGIQKQLKYAADYLGYDKIGTHSFRKQGAMYVFRKSNNDVTVASRFLGHSSPAITMRYLTECDTVLDSVLDTMAI